MTITTLLILIWMHFIADFILQSNWMAQNKSKHNIPLLIHIGVYSLPFLYFSWEYALINGVAHLITDWFSSRATSKLWAEKKVHWFFVVVGLDQAIHMTTLILTYVWLFGGV